LVSTAGAISGSIYIAIIAMTHGKNTGRFLHNHHFPSRFPEELMNSAPRTPASFTEVAQGPSYVTSRRKLDGIHYAHVSNLLLCFSGFGVRIYSSK
jgi:hypothetical protein